MPKPPKRRVYLVSVSQGREPVRVYAVLVATPNEALEAVVLKAPRDAQVEIVGGLARDLAKRMRLKPGELHLV